MNYTTEKAPVRTHRQKGMTLIELTVVLLVLIGLSGLLIPYVSGFMQRTHDGTGTANLGRLNNEVQRFITEKMRLPNGLHSLYDTTNAGIYGDLMNPAVVTARVVDGTAAGVADKFMSDSLSMAGLKTVYGMTDALNNASATFDAADVATGPLDHTAGAQNLAFVTPLDLDGNATTTASEVVEQAFGKPKGSLEANDACYDYAVFGIGQETELVGSVLTDAPIHFAQQGSMGPDNKYNRFVAVFQVDKNNTAPCSAMTEPAKYIGAGMVMMANHVIGLAEELGSAYKNIAN